ncbi:MAG TPA: 1-acyl-sn-glycerol-3-phosphate acyltransferase [Dermatophilaceae bacterium]|nr:1-acyl-sn-glycerol-3-phosphate acyltransferase [Dermatophilaceae bacterium]
MTRQAPTFSTRVRGARQSLTSAVKKVDLPVFDPKFEVEAPRLGALLQAAHFQDGLRVIADTLGRRYEDLQSLAEVYLREMWAVHSVSVTTWWDRFGTWLLRGYELVVDVDGLRGLRTLDHDHSLVFLMSHRSYLDEWAFPGAVHQAGINRLSSFMGANLDYFPMGAIARRVGMMHVRRAIRGDQVYKHALRSYISQLIADRVNLMWSIEGGRTRTGKLRPPRLGLLRFLVDSVDTLASPEVYIVPASILYDQIPTNEVRLMALEALGGSKRPENARWFLDYISKLNTRMGRVYLNVGEPLPLRERLAELRAEDPSGRTVVERLGVDVSHRINQATPVTATAAVCIALLGAGRALNLSEVLATIRPLADYLDRRGWPTAGGVNLRDRASIRSALKSLVDTTVLDAHDADEAVWSIAPTQHLTAANYRNSAIHVLLEPAITEVGLMGVMMSGNPTHDAYAEASRLRDLLKFEFFFARGREFAARLCSEIGVDVDDPEFSSMMTPQQAEEYFDRLQIHVAVLVLRPFLDAYAVVAHELAGLPPHRDIEEAKFLQHCLAVGKQWVLRKLVASDESNSLEMFRNTYQLAAHRGLLDPDSPDVAARRLAFRDEIDAYRLRMDEITERMRSKDARLLGEAIPAAL